MVPFEARPLFIRHFRFSNARVSLSRGILIGFGRLAVRRTDGGTSFLPLERIPFGVLDRFPDSRKTHDRGCCLVKGGDRPASKNKRSRDATQERNRCCRCVRGGEVFASDEESFHGRRGTMGNLKTRARRTRVFLSFPPQLCPPDFPLSPIFFASRFQGDEYSQGSNDRGGFGLRA